MYYSFHAAAYTAVLFLAGIFGERPKSGKEVVLATQRALEQQALERWRMQKEARIDQMAKSGEPLTPVAAALASPETAERIAVLEAADRDPLGDGCRTAEYAALWSRSDALARVASDDERRRGERGSPFAGSRQRARAKLVVGLRDAEGVEAPRGRQWTAEQFAQRDAYLAQLRIHMGKRGQH
jgi:hypothetical protein